ncbi:bifunctional epoxide hydrolase 2-like [Sarcophilus harrisii]
MDKAIFLDDDEANLKKAREVGMVTIFVQDTDVALKELEKSTGIQFLHQNKMRPIVVQPSNVVHGYVEVKPGMQQHFVEMGSGPVVVLCHGFPESWFSWRYQIPALAEAGYWVIVPDMKEIEEYSQEVICKELIVFLDKLGIFQAVFIGHDWGGVVVWNLALWYPERVRAVASLNIPFRPADPAVPFIEKIKSNPIFHYQLYFQEPGVAEVELEKDLNRTFKLIFRASDEKNTANKCLRKHLNSDLSVSRDDMTFSCPTYPNVNQETTEWCDGKNTDLQSSILGLKYWLCHSLVALT